MSAAAQTVWRYSNWLPPTHPVTTGVVQVWAKQVEQSTHGRVRIEVLSALGAPPAHFDLVRNGVADASSITTSYTAGRFPLLKGLELPFLSNSNSAMSVAAQRTYDRFFGAGERVPRREADGHSRGRPVPGVHDEEAGRP